MIQIENEIAPEIIFEVRSTVFWAHLEAKDMKSHKMERFTDEKTASEFFDWINSTLEDMEKECSRKCTITNCGIIR